jgi:putative glutamine amidotransferase
MPTPIIGITTSSRVTPYGTTQFGLGQSYTSALIAAGAIPLLIPLDLLEEQIDELVLRLDGILFSGGGDVAPQIYGSQAHPLVSEVDPARDRLEIRLAQQAVQSGLPVMGVCRGLQLINVALGGTLYEDILDQHPGAIQHSYSSETQRDYLAHDVRIEANSLLSRIIGLSHTAVNSLHHQGIRRLAPQMVVSAVAPDDVIEAVEIEGHPFGLAVQWHPECLQTQATMRALFSAFSSAAQNQAAPSR